jgi:predicted nucleic acid-binding protein
MDSAAGNEPTPVVIDTMLATAALSPRRHPLFQRYGPYLLGRPLVLSFVTVSQLRYGAHKGGWAAPRIARLEQFLRDHIIVMRDSDLVAVCASLRWECEKSGHALHQKVHEADRWIAATAMRHDFALMSDDRIFIGVPGLKIHSAAVPGIDHR